MAGTRRPVSLPSAPEWLGFAVRLTVTFNQGSGYGLNASYTVAPIAGTLSQDPDERLLFFLGVACSNANVRYTGTPTTCTTPSSNQVAGFVSPDFALSSLFVPVLTGTPGAFIDAGTAGRSGITLTATPEPSSLILIVMGVLGAVGASARGRRRVG